MEGGEACVLQNARSVAGDFFSRAVHRAGKDGDFHQSDPEAESKTGDLTSWREKTAIESQLTLMASGQPPTMP
ncbi:hypothetical protein D3C86_2171350 [compost metagenome]